MCIHNILISCKTLHQCRRQHWQSAVCTGSNSVQVCTLLQATLTSTTAVCRCTLLQYCTHCTLLEHCATLCTVSSVQDPALVQATLHTAHCCNTVHTGASNRIQHWCKQHWAPTLTSKSNKCRVGRYGCGGPTQIYWTWYMYVYIYWVQ